MSSAAIICIEEADVNGTYAAIFNIDNRGSVASLESDLRACFDAGSVPNSPGRLCAFIAAWYEAHATVNPSVSFDAGGDVATMVMLSTERANGMPVGQVLFPASGDIQPLDLGEG